MRRTDSRRLVLSRERADQSVRALFLIPRTLSRDGFKQRLQLSRAPFPDLTFELIDVIPAADRVAISWTMRGTQTGPMGDRPPSGRSIAIQGMTVYYFADGQITGHRQVVDRITAARQLGLVG